MPTHEQHLKRHNRTYWMIAGLMGLISVILLSSTYGERASTSYAKLSDFRENDLGTIAVHSHNGYAWAIKNSADNFIHLTGSTSRVLIWMLLIGFVWLVIESLFLRSKMRLVASVAVPVVVVAFLGNGIDAWTTTPQLTRAVPIISAFGLLFGIGLLNSMERGWVFPGPVKNRIPNAPPERTPANEHSSSSV